MSPEDPQSHYPPPAGKSLQSGGRGATDEERGNYPKLPKTRKQPRSSKFLVYLLFLTVILAAVLLCFAAVVRPKSLQLRIADAAANNMSVKRSNATGDPSTSPATLNGTLVATLVIGNPNFGRFEYRNSTVVVVYGESAAAVVGQEVVAGGHVPIKGTRRLQLRIAIGSTAGGPVSGEDMGSGVVKLRCVGELSGRVYVAWNRLKWWKTSYLNCSMKLLLSTMEINDLDCK